MYSRLARALMVVVGVAATGAFAASATDPKYRITDIGTLGGHFTGGNAMNKSGQITGYSGISGDVLSHAFIWRNDGTPMLDLGTLGLVLGSSSRGSWGQAINSSGQVAGSVDRGNYIDLAFLWKNNGRPAISLGTLYGIDSDASAINDSGQVTGTSDGGAAFVWLNDGRPMQDLGTLGGNQAGGEDINASGQVTGSAQPSYQISHAFFWKNDGTPMQDLGTLGGTNSRGYFINSSGQIAGTSEVKPFGIASHAFLWKNNGTPMVNLGTLGGAISGPSAVNEFGQVAGTSTVHGLDTSTERAFVWRNDGTRMLNLGTLGGPASSGYDINAAGWVVGGADTSSNRTHAFLWRNDGRGMRDLNNLIDPTDPLKPYVVLDYGLVINDAGDIMASGYDTRDTGGWLRTYFVRGSSLALSPLSLAFGNQKANTTSAAKAVTVQNNGTSAVLITGIRLAGANAGQFAFTHNCGTTLAGRATCTINVKFKPATKGAKSAVLNVNGGGGGLRSVSLTGTGI